MLLNEGNKVLIAHRRLYHGDAARFFVGQIEAYENGLLRVRGYSFVRNVSTGQLVEKSEARTRILSLSSGTLIVYLLPDDTSLETVTLTWSDKGLTATDGKQFTMNLSEYTHAGREQQ